MKDIGDIIFKYSIHESFYLRKNFSTILDSLKNSEKVYSEYVEKYVENCFVDPKLVIVIERVMEDRDKILLNYSTNRNYRNDCLEYGKDDMNDPHLRYLIKMNDIEYCDNDDDFHFLIRDQKIKTNKIILKDIIIVILISTMTIMM